MKNAVISGVGSYLPVQKLTNKDLEKTIDTNHEWIASRTGIHERFIAQNHESNSFMAAEAAKAALNTASLDANDIDLIIVTTCTAEYNFPSVACFVQHTLNIKKNIPAFDISAACSGFIYAMDIAKQYIATGVMKHVLVIGSERMSQAVDWTDRSTCILFGDGAGAVVLSASDNAGILGSVIHSSFDETQSLIFPTAINSGQCAKVSMRGNEVFKVAVNIMGDVVDEVLNLCQLKRSDIDWLIPHQANIRIINAIAKKLELPMSQVIVTIEHQGNTSAASIPLALDSALKKRYIKRGDTLLLVAFGGGMTWGAMVIRY